jgi:hypothetical protein
VAAVVDDRVQDAATVPFAEILTGAGQVTVSPVAGLTTAMRLILPAKLNVLVRPTDIADPVAPELKLTGVPVEIVKSPTWTVDNAEWDAEPGEPAAVMVTPKVRAVVELKVHETATVAFAVILTGAGQVTVNPAGLTIEVRPIVPAKLKVLVRLTDIAEPVAPELKFTGLPTEIEKSPTCETKPVE